MADHTNEPAPEAAESTPTVTDTEAEPTPVAVAPDTYPEALFAAPQDPGEVSDNDGLISVSTVWGYCAGMRL